MKSFCLHAIGRGMVYIQYALPNTCSLAKLNEMVSRNLSEFEDACIDGKRSFRALRGWWLKQWITRLFHGGSMVKNLPSMQETWVRSLDWEDPMEKGMKTHPFSCLENSMDEEPGRLQSMMLQRVSTTEWLSTQAFPLSTSAVHRVRDRQVYT